MRRQDWPEKLNQYLVERGQQCAQWGVNDCGMTFGDAVLAMTDVDPVARFRGTYRTRHGAMRLMKRSGGWEALIEQVATEFGYAEITPRQAGRGDTVLIDSSFGPCLGVVSLNPRFTAVPRLTKGLELVPTVSGRRAWRIS